MESTTENEDLYSHNDSSSDGSVSSSDNYSLPSNYLSAPNLANVPSKSTLTPSFSRSMFHLPDDFAVPDVGNCIGIDFGGTLTKLVFFQPDSVPLAGNVIAEFVTSASKYGTSGERDLHLSFRSLKLKGTFHFIRFSSNRTLGALKLVKNILNLTNDDNLVIKQVEGTGGGASKYKETIKNQLGIDIHINDEFKSVVTGLVFALLEDREGECYSYVDFNNSMFRNNSRSASSVHSMSSTANSNSRNSKSSLVDLEVDLDAKDEDLILEPRKVGPPLMRVRHRSGSADLDMVKVNYPIMNSSKHRLFPFLVVNIGSGVSILKVDSPQDFERVTGTGLGGATFLGLCKLLCNCDDFDHALKLAETGDDRSINLLVEDIYGGPLKVSSPSKKKPGVSVPKFLNQINALDEEKDNGLSKEFVLKGDHTAAFFGKCIHEKASANHTTSVKRKWDFNLTEKIILVAISLFCAILMGVLFQLYLYGTMISVGIVPFFFYVLARLSKTSFDVTPVLPTDEKSKLNPLNDHRKEDLAKALVVMISQNITQIAFMAAKLHNIDKIMFTGSFLRHNEIAQITLTKNLKIWSNDSIVALFMEHEGYFGALGSFLRTAERE